MNVLLIRLYPESWRRRYGEELAALLEVMPTTPATLVDLAVAALRIRLETVLRTVRQASGDGSVRSAAPLAALLLLLPSVVALSAIALRFTAGIAGPFELVWFGAPLMTRYVVLILPALALATAIIPLLSVAPRIASGRVSVAVGVRLDRMSSLVGILSGCVLAALLRYFLVRHLLPM